MLPQESHTQHLKDVSITVKTWKYHTSLHTVNAGNYLQRKTTHTHKLQFFSKKIRQHQQQNRNIVSLRSCYVKLAFLQALLGVTSFIFCHKRHIDLPSTMWSEHEKPLQLDKQEFAIVIRC